MAKGKNKTDVLGKGLLGKTPKGLKPTKKKAIKKQASQLIRDLYKPAIVDIKQQEKATLAVNEKRAADNKHYTNWLQIQAAQNQAHAQAADQELRKQQADIQKSAQESLAGIRDEIQEGVQGQAGVVSGDSESATALDTSPEAARAAGQIANERIRTEQQIGSNTRASQTEQASNFAAMAAAEATRQADMYKRLSELGDARTQVKLERAAKTSEEVARLLDKEIEKAQARVQMRQLAAQLGLSLKELRLNKKKFKFDKRATLKELNEAERHNKATEKTDAAEAREDKRHNKALEELEGKKIKVDKLEDANATAQEKKEVQRKIKHVVNNGIIALKSKPQWRKLAENQPHKAIQKLTRRGMDPIFAKASVELAANGKISAGTAKRMKSIGFNIPNNWR